jgi:acyl-CoA reductase-like NAD-dependent aldehyde dehydrogenase
MITDWGVSLVCSDADLDLAAKNIVKGGFSYSGQRCTAVKVVLVMQDVADALVAKVRQQGAETLTARAGTGDSSRGQQQEEHHHRSALHQALCDTAPASPSGSGCRTHNCCCPAAGAAYGASAEGGAAAG